MTNEPLVVTESDISTAWGRVFLRATATGVESLSPLVVTVNLGDELSREKRSIRTALDDRIASLKRSNPAKYGKLQAVQTAANTIFPASYWNPDAQDDAELLFKRFSRAWPRIKRCHQNKRGSYFRRMTASRPKNPTDPPVNQLQHIVDTYHGGNHRRSALQASVFDPALDHNNARQLGFPCLHQVSFAPMGDSGLAVTGFYAMQYVFDRAYGNYLGLCRLGEFMGSQLGMKLSRVTCVAATAELGTANKRDVSELAENVRTLVERTGEVAV